MTSPSYARGISVSWTEAAGVPRMGQRLIENEQYSTESRAPLLVICPL